MGEYRDVPNPREFGLGTSVRGPLLGCFGLGWVSSFGMGYVSVEWGGLTWGSIPHRARRPLISCPILVLLDAACAQSCIAPDTLVGLSVPLFSTPERALAASAQPSRVQHSADWQHPDALEASAPTRTWRSTERRYGCGVAVRSVELRFCDLVGYGAWLACTAITSFFRRVHPPRH